MIPENFLKLDSVLNVIRLDRYDLGKTADFEHLLTRLTEFHDQYSESLDAVMNEYLGLPHTKAFVEKVTAQKNVELHYLREKSNELSKELEEDDLITMQPEAVNFMSALQVYLSHASGKFLDSQGQEKDIAKFIEPNAFTLPENYTGKFKTTSLRYEHRTETGALIQDDLGYKFFLVRQQLDSAWTEIVLAYEKLKFIRKVAR